MPGTVIGTDKLQQLTLAPDEKVRGHLKTLNTFEVGVQVPVKLVGKQTLNSVALILSGRQADAVQHNHVDPDRQWSWTKIR
jgi:hypothetical protein